MLSLLSRLLLVGAFLPIFLGWLNGLPGPMISPRLPISPLAQSVLIFVVLGAVAWVSLRFQRGSLGFLFALGGFGLVWSLMLSGGL